MIVPMIIAGIAAGTLAALMSLYLGSGLVFSACLYVATGGLAFIFSSILFSVRFIISRIWWSLNIDLRVNIIISNAVIFSVILFAWAVFIGIKGNLQWSLISLAVGAISIPAWLSYTFDNFAARLDANRIDDYL